MAHFHELCHGNCCLWYIEGIVELRKLDFRSLNDQFGVKMASFTGLLSEIDYLGTTLPFRIPVWPIFMIYGMKVVP